MHARKFVVSWLLALTVAVTAAALAGCHPAPPRPKEPPQMTEERKAKQGD